MPPKRVPMVSTGRCSNVTAAVAPKVTIMAPGTRLAYFKQKIMMAREASATAVAWPGNAFGEPSDHGRGKILPRRANAGNAEKDEQTAGHNGAHEEAVDAVFGDNAGNDYDECAGRPADLRFGAAESGHDESSDDGAIDSGLWGHAGGDGKGHGQRQRDQADGYSRNEVGQKFVAIVIAQQDYVFGQPGV